MKLEVPWTEERAEAMGDDVVITQARLQLSRLRHSVQFQHWLTAGQALLEISTKKLHHALGYPNLQAFWKDEFPLTERQWFRLRSAAIAVRCAPRLEKLYDDQVVSLGDLEEAGVLARSCHSASDVELVACDRSARRAMALAIMVRGGRRTAIAGAGKKLPVPNALLEGDWRRAETEYRRWLKQQPINLADGTPRRQTYKRPPFGVVLTWLLSDWIRLRSAEAAKAREVKAFCEEFGDKPRRGAKS